MKNPALLYLLFLMLAFCASCGQKAGEGPAAYVKSEYADTVAAHGPRGQMVRNVRQMRNGDILIVSYGGVWRYDGKTYTKITSRIPAPSFWDVLEDRKGNLWFATHDSGVYRYDGESFQHFTTRHGLPSNYGVLRLFEDKAGTIWFATARGASRYDGKSFRNFKVKDGLPHDGVQTFMEDRSGHLWIGTRGEPCFYDGKTFTVFKNAGGKAFRNVWAITEDKKGNIWLGDMDGLWHYDGTTITHVSRNFTGAIVQDRDGNLWTTGQVNPPHGRWVLTRYDAQSLYDKEPRSTEIASVENTPLCGILEAQDGSIWCGSMGLEAAGYRYDGKTFQRM